MPLGLGIVEVLRAIPPRIEVAGHGPTVRVTAGSFDAALDYAQEAYGSAAAVDVDVRNRLWPRVTVTVTTDPRQAEVAPPVEELRIRAARRDEALRASRAARRARPGTHRAGPEPVEGPPAARTEPGSWMLEEIFAHQEQLRLERARVPHQRQGVD